MAQEFIKAAEIVLKEYGQPLLVKDIYQLSIEKQLLKSGGKTPINTLRARLSEHIRKENLDSIFKRIGPNKFALREWDQFTEYPTKPYDKNRSKEIVVAVKQDLIEKNGRFFGFSEKYEPFLKDLESNQNIVLCNREEAKSRFDIKQLVSYVLIKDGSGKILSYVRGNYGQKESLLLGVLCLGFGGHVNNIDINLFSNDAGIANSAVREINEEIKGLIVQNLKLIGVINDDSSPLGFNHFAFVFEALLPNDFNLEKFHKEKAISKVKTISNVEVWDKFHELEFWSQLLVKKLIPKPPKYLPVFVKAKPKKYSLSPLAIVGELGCGKSEVASYMNKNYQIPIISTRICISRLINLPDFEIGNRSDFQTKSFEFISHPDGIKKLTDQIAAEIKKLGTNVIIDGIRNIETYNRLKAIFPNLNLMYIDVTRDTAFKLFKQRSRNKVANIHEFRIARDHDVEKEIILFKTRADIYLFNGGTLQDLTKTIKNWWDATN